MYPWWQEPGDTTYDQSHVLIVSKVNVKQRLDRNLQSHLLMVSKVNVK